MRNVYAGLMLMMTSSLFSSTACTDATSPSTVARPLIQAANPAQFVLVTPSTIPQLSAGWLFTCALTAQGSVICWGHNDDGQSSPPAGLAAVARVSAGGYHACALKADGTVTCWGNNRSGQTTVPIGLSSVAEVSAGHRHTCALRTNGTVVCWGDNTYGPTSVPAGLGSVAQLTSGAYHTCALKTDGTVICWGNNVFGAATAPGGLSSVKQVSAGSGYHNCALKTDGTVVCWGWDGNGRTAVPEALASIEDISAGANHTCARKTNRTIVCWGNTEYGAATVPNGLDQVLQVSVGTLHTCVLKTDWKVLCWGNNGWFQLNVPVGLTLGPSDVTPPAITHAIQGTPSASGWYGSDVTVDFVATDPESSVTTSGCDQGTVSATTSVDGVTFTCVAKSAGGQTTHAVTIRLDKTIPTVSGSVTGTLGTNDWYTSDVQVLWTASVAGPSGQTLASDCNRITLTSDTQSYAFSCSAVTGAGITSVVESVMVKRDATKPVVVYAGNVGSYTVDQTVAITCIPNDNLSGIASSTCAAINGDGYDFAVGANSYSATATDKAGNIGSAPTSFTVAVTPRSLCNLVRRWVTNDGVANSLCVKLDRGSYDSFRNELSAQTGKKITDGNAAIAMRLVNVLDQP